jgi:hypothetical protein
LCQTCWGSGQVSEGSVMAWFWCELYLRHWCGWAAG